MTDLGKAGGGVGVAKPTTDRSTTTRGFAAASAMAKASVRRAAGRRGIAEARLLTHWPDVAGARLAQITRPTKVKQRGGHALAGVLVLSVDGARASEIEHEIPQIIERVNAFYGYSAIADVQLQRATGPLPSLARPKPAKAPEVSDLPTAQRETVENATRDVEDDALRSALARLGANVMAKSTAKSTAKSAAKAGGKAVALGGGEIGSRFITR